MLWGALPSHAHSTEPQVCTPHSHPSPKWWCAHTQRGLCRCTLPPSPGRPGGDRKLSQPTTLRSRDRRREPLLPPQPLLSLLCDNIELAGHLKVCAHEHQLCVSFLWALPAGTCLRPCARPGPAQCAGSMPLCGQSEEALLRGFHKPRSPRWFLLLLLFWPRGCWEQGKDARDGQGPVKGTHRWVPGMGGF